jgi:hypothetical protein
MSELKKLLVLKLHAEASLETINKLQDQLKPIAEAIGAQPLVVDQHMDVQYHDNDILERLDRLCNGIEDLVEVNQAILEYMIQADEVDTEPQAGATLDG